MKREILFRGKRSDNGVWVEGYFLEFELCDGKGKRQYIKVNGYPPAAVDPETVGQFTGMTDKNGKRIFEGDKGIHEIFGEVYVKYLIQECGFVYVSKDSDYRMGKRNIIRCGYIFDNNFEITCNIHDNPELL